MKGNLVKCQYDGTIIWDYLSLTSSTYRQHTQQYSIVHTARKSIQASGNSQMCARDLVSHKLTPACSPWLLLLLLANFSRLLLAVVANVRVYMPGWGQGCCRARPGSRHLCSLQISHCLWRLTLNSVSSKVWRMDWSEVNWSNASKESRSTNAPL